MTTQPEPDTGLFWRRPHPGFKKAREIEADEERSQADELLKRLARMKPEPRTSKRPKN